MSREKDEILCQNPVSVGTSFENTDRYSLSMVIWPGFTFLYSVSSLLLSLFCLVYPINAFLTCVSQLSVMTSCFREINLKQERFVLAHSFRSFSPKSTGSIALDLRQGRILWWQSKACDGGGCSPRGSQESRRKRERKRERERERERETWYKIDLSKHTPSDLLPSNSEFLLPPNKPFSYELSLGFIC
jgi:hypothetical protein